MTVSGKSPKEINLLYYQDEFKHAHEEVELIKEKHALDDDEFNELIDAYLKAQNALQMLVYWNLVEGGK